VTGEHRRRLGAVAGLAVAVLAGHGSCAQELACPQSAICCQGFGVGLNDLVIDWGLASDAENLRISTFFHAIEGALSAAVDGSHAVAASCDRLAASLGGGVGTAIEDASPGGDARVRCSRAADLVRTARAASGWSLQPAGARCTIDVARQIACDQACADDACSGDLADVASRCPAGELEGLCTGTCTGTCVAPLGAPTHCLGACQGECSGTCEGECAALGADGLCLGACDGICEGTCDGPCDVDGDRACRDLCRGACDALISPACSVPLAPPAASCGGGSTCAVGCASLALVDATCDRPSIALVGAVDDPGARAAARELAQLLAERERAAALGASLPELERALRAVERGAAAPSGTSGSIDVCLPTVRHAIDDAAVTLAAIVAAVDPVVAAATTP
jgi:hypothetical protein